MNRKADTKTPVLPPSKNNNYVVRIISAAIAWLILLIYVNLIPPDNRLHLVVFFLLIFLSLFLSSFIFIKKFARNILIALYFLILILLSYFHILNWLNAALTTILLIVTAYLT